MTYPQASTISSRLVVLISGQGSNLQAIIEACQQSVLNAEIVSVISNRATALGLQRARQAGIPSKAFTPHSKEMRADYDRRLADFISSLQPDWIILAGWMRLLSNTFLGRFPKQVINLHPALPGCFPGTHAIERAFASWQRGEIQYTGIMVHEVPDEGIDSGPVLAQVQIPIHPTDTLESLTARIHQAEHQLLVSSLQTLVNRPLSKKVKS